MRSFSSVPYKKNLIPQSASFEHIIPEGDSNARTQSIHLSQLEDSRYQQQQPKDGDEAVDLIITEREISIEKD